jgi:putative acetyltransferase
MAQALVTPVRTAEDLDVIRTLFREYADSLDIDLAFQGFAAEFAQLPGKYAPPTGELLLARGQGAPLGCVGIRPLATDGVCEVKRLFVRAAGRGTGAGRALAAAAVAFAAEAGYRQVVLDTLPSMTAAIALYQSLGFEPVPRYWDNSVPDALYFGKRLIGQAPGC